MLSLICLCIHPQLKGNLQSKCKDFCAEPSDRAEVSISIKCSVKEDFSLFLEFDGQIHWRCIKAFLFLVCCTCEEYWNCIIHHPKSSELPTIPSFSRHYRRGHSHRICLCIPISRFSIVFLYKHARETFLTPRHVSHVQNINFQKMWIFTTMSNTITDSFFCRKQKTFILSHRECPSLSTDTQEHPLSIFISL